MGTDRKVGICILAFVAMVGFIVLAGILFGGNVAFGTFLGIFVALILYIGLIATVYDEDPFVWTYDKIEDFIDKRKGKSDGGGN